MNGKLIVIDGLDGSGKGTHAKRLVNNLLNCGQEVRAVSFPNYNDNSSALVKMYLQGEFGNNAGSVNPYAASTFYSVDRVASFIKDWKKDYDSGKIIVADRYTTSNIIHQTEKLPRDKWNDFIDWLLDFEYNKLALPKPDVVLYLDMPVEISKELIMKRYNGDESKKDIHENDFEYLKRCREAALYAADRLGWTVLELSDGYNAYSKEENEQRVSKCIYRELGIEC